MSCDECCTDPHGCWKECLAAEARLATASALIRMVVDSPYSFPLDGLEAFLANQRRRAPTRTEAERAVLDATGAWDAQLLRIYAKSDESDHFGGTRGTPLEARLAPLCRAEFARRGLK